MNPENKSKSKARLKLIMDFLKGAKLFFVLSILAAAVTALADTITPQILRVSIDNILSGTEEGLSGLSALAVKIGGGVEYLAEHLWIPAIAIMVVALFKVASQYAFRVYNSKGSETLVKTMRDKLFTHIERLPMQWHMENHTGDIIQRCTSDIDTMRNFVSEQMTGIFRIAIMLVMSIAFMFSMDWLLALIALFPTPVILIYSFRFHKTVRSEFEVCDTNEGKLSAMVQENLTGVRVVRAFGREKYEFDRFDKHNKFYTGLWVKVAKSLSTYWTVSDFLCGIQTMLVIVFGVVFCLNRGLARGELIAFITYNQMLVWPVRQLGRMISEMSKASVSIERVQFIMESKEEEDKPGAGTPSLDGDICFEHVSFGYKNCPEMLHDISFTVKKGTTLGILGGTGSGKSTLMYLLDKLYELPEDHGRITVNGTDIRDIQTHYLRSNIGFVQQEPFLFSRTIAENIGITNPELDMDAVRAAAKDACLDDTVNAFAQGYNTAVGERGVTLSGGQKQRAAIARMLTQKAPIMILDDSLSAVDTQTDAKIRHALEGHFGEATVIIISHRITTLSHTDKIVVLDHGRVSETGTHDELKDAGGIYSKIYKAQSGIEEEVCA